MEPAKGHYVHRPVAFVLNWIEEEIFFARFHGMCRTNTDVIDPTVVFVGEEAILNAFKTITLKHLNHVD